VFNTKKKYRWPWQKSKPDDASPSGGLTDDTASADNPSLQKHPSPQ
jgi:hypothetical protein